MKKTHLSPVASLVVSFSLAFGILVSDLAGYRFLTAVSAQNGSPSGRGNSLKINEGVALNGIRVRALHVDGRVVNGVIAGSVRLVSSTVGRSHEDAGNVDVDASGVVVGDTVSVTGVVVGDTLSVTGVVVGDTLSISGVVVGDTLSVSGVVVGDTLTNTSGVVVGDQNASPEVGLNGVTVINGKASGGTLTGDGITVSEDGVITGENLVLMDTSIHGGSVHVTLQTSEAH